jgi:hypothetical protein
MLERNERANLMAGTLGPLLIAAAGNLLARCRIPQAGYAVALNSSVDQFTPTAPDHLLHRS